MSRNLSAHDLLEGAMYAMEQAGHLLHDAVGLYERGRYSSAVVLSVYAREEMGRAEIFQVYVGPAESTPARLCVSVSRWLSSS